MLSRCVLLVLAFALSLSVQAQAPAALPGDAGSYAEVCFAQPTEALVRDLARAGVALDHAHREKTTSGVETCAVLNAAEQARLDQAGVPYRVDVPDLEAAYAAALPQRQAMLRAMRSQAFDLERFEFGSMGGYYTFDEVVAKLDQLRADFPTLITEKASIGTTLEGREIWMVEIGDNPGVDEGEPEVLYTAVHHAREPQSMTTVLYYMIYLLERYGTDPEVTYLVDNRRLTFVPILNPDGYVYNETTDPSGGGFWRKNRRDNGGGNFGVDPNRNYGYEWGYDNSGSSGSPSSDTYRGPAPFSEIETASLRDFVEARDFRLAYNYHSYSNVLIYPWGYERDLFTPDSARYADYGALLTAANGYGYGTTNQTIGYIVNGSSDDWFYGEQTTKEKIYAFTPEVGTREDNFWPMPDRIEPLAQENIDANLLLAWVAGGFPQVEVLEVSEAPLACEACVENGYVDRGETLEARIEIANVGLEDLDATYRLVDTSGYFAPDPDATGTFSLALDGRTEVVLLAEVDPDTPLGLIDGLVLEVEIGSVVRTFQLPPVLVGTLVTVFEDQAANLAAWLPVGTADWGIEMVAADPAFSDSPGRLYLDNTDATLRLDPALDLSEVTTATLTFRTRWEIEAGYDYGQVLVSTDGVTFEPLEGRYTLPGSEFSQPEVAGQPLYDGVMLTWVEELIDLSAYAGEEAVTLAFRLWSDGSVVGDGWYVDDVVVSTLVDGTVVDAEDRPKAAMLSLGAPYPNPAADALSIPFTLPAATDVRLEVFDVLGRRVAALVDQPYTAGTHTLAWDGRDRAGHTLSVGTYVIRLVADGQVQTQRFVQAR